MAINTVGLSYAGWTGKLDIDRAIKDINNTDNAWDAHLILQVLMNDAETGLGGISKNDAKSIIKAYEAYGNRYDIDVSSETLNINNAIKNDTLNDKNSLIRQGLINIDPVHYQDINGNKASMTPTTGTTTTNKNNSGTASTGSGTNNKKTTTTVKAPATTVGTVNTNTVSSPSTPPKFSSAEEAAKKHGIDYNYDNILAGYNKATNEYYDAAVAEQEANRTKYLQASNNYVNRIMNEYLDSYTNAAATASGRGTTAASALMTDLNAQSTNTANDLGMLQSVNNLEAYREAELANNPNLAQQYYNKLGTYLSDLSTSEYQANVNKYVNELDAYSQTYAADRLLSAAEASAAASKYAGLASSSKYAATAAANSTNNWNKLYNYYLTQYGNDKAAANAVINNIQGGKV